MTKVYVECQSKYQKTSSTFFLTSAPMPIQLPSQKSFTLSRLKNSKSNEFSHKTMSLSCQCNQLINIFSDHKIHFNQRNGIQFAMMRSRKKRHKLQLKTLNLIAHPHFFIMSSLQLFSIPDHFSHSLKQKSENFLKIIYISQPKTSSCSLQHLSSSTEDKVHSFQSQCQRKFKFKSKGIRKEVKFWWWKCFSERNSKVEWVKENKQIKKLKKCNVLKNAQSNNGKESKAKSQRQ